MCVKFIFSFTNKEIITFDTTPFLEIDKKQIYP